MEPSLVCTCGCTRFIELIPFYTNGAYQQYDDTNPRQVECRNCGKVYTLTVSPGIGRVFLDTGI